MAREAPPTLSVTLRMNKLQLKNIAQYKKTAQYRRYRLQAVTDVLLNYLSEPLLLSKRTDQKRNDV